MLPFRRLGQVSFLKTPILGGDLLCPWRQSRQNAPGDASDGLRLRFAPPRSIGRFPRPPLRGFPLGMGKNFRRAKFEWLFAIPSGPLRRRGFRIPRFARLGKARSLHRSSSPTQTRFAGLCVGGRLRRPIGVENFKWFGSATAPSFDEPTLLVRFPL